MLARLVQQRGFSAIEVLVGMTLLAIIAAALGSQMTVSTVTAQQSKERARALGLARAQADRLRSLDYRDIAMPSNSQDTTQQQSDWASLYCPVPASADTARCGKDSEVLVRARKSSDWDAAYITDVSVGQYHACGVGTDGSIYCWGWNGWGQLGNGTTITSSTPVKVSGLSNVVQVSTGATFSCALLVNSTVYCWGRNTFGQLGNGNTNNSYTPVQVSGIASATAISSAVDSSCALLQDSSVKCWGYGGYGNLGNGATNNSSTPVTVSGISSATQVSVGDVHACARLSDGSVTCWGRNTYGQLGNATTTSSSTPVAVSGVVDAAQVATGIAHSCATRSNGTLLCWGYNGSGEFGNGTYTNATSPVAAGRDISNAVRLSAGGETTCALLSSAQVKCWGNNVSGKLGIGSSTSQFTTPQLLSFSSSLADVAVGAENSTCFARIAAKPACTGGNGYGQLGNGTTTGSTTPVSVSIPVTKTENSVDSWKSASEDAAVIGTRADPRIGKQVERLDAGQLPQSAVNTHTVNGITLYTYIYWGGESMSSGTSVFTPKNRQWKVIEVVARYRDLPSTAQFSGQADRARYSSVTVVQPVYDGPGAGQIPSS